MADTLYVGANLQEFLERHRAAIWDCHSRGRACCAQVHQDVVRDLEQMAIPVTTRAMIRARILEMERRENPAS